MSIPSYIRKLICKHVMTPPHVVTLGNFYKSIIEHPSTGKIEIMRQDIASVSVCVKCGKEVKHYGYNSQPIPEDPEAENLRRIAYIKSLSRGEIIRTMIQPNLYKSHPNPAKYLEWLETQPDELVYNMAIRMELR